jgi:predicted hydrocarbon binding protein
LAITKGITFTHARSYVEETYGPEGWSDVLAASPRDDRAILGSIVAVGWYDLGAYARLLRTIDETFGKGDLELLAAIGRYGAEKDITTVYRLFFRLQSPAYAIEKIAEYWRKFHDTGVWTVERQGDGHAHGTLRDWGYVDRTLCREMISYMTRVLQLVGAKDVRLAHPLCRAEGEKECFFTLRWRGKDGR